MATTRRARRQLSSAWPPERGWGPVPQLGGQAGEVGKVARRAAHGQAVGCGRGQLVGDGGAQALVAGAPKNVGDPVGRAPAHPRLAGEARVRAQQDLDSGPARPDLGDDPRHLVDRAGRGVDVRAPQLGREQLAAAEHVQRQLAVAIIVPVNEAALLMAVQGIIRGIEVKNDLFGR